MPHTHTILTIRQEGNGPYRCLPAVCSSVAASAPAGSVSSPWRPLRHPLRPFGDGRTLRALGRARGPGKTLAAPVSELDLSSDTAMFSGPGHNLLVGCFGSSGGSLPVTCRVGLAFLLFIVDVSFLLVWFRKACYRRGMGGGGILFSVFS
jgi:hypothetical protein